MLNELNKSYTSNIAHWRRRLISGTATIALHLLGTATFFTASWWLLIPLETRQALREAYHHGAIQIHSTELLLHAGLSACFWAMLFIGYKLLTTPRKRTPRLISARGTVIVETLIVFPLFLLLTLGLLQLILVNTAGLLTSLAAFNAGRAISVWAPEIGRRNDVERSLVLDKARVAAAMALAPVAPADFITTNCGSGSTTLSKQLEGLRSTGHTSTTNILAATDGNASLSVNRAFDLSNFETRGRNKLNFAYCATEIESNISDSTQGTSFNVQVNYKHQLAMPVVAVVFGGYSVVEGRPGFYSTITRSHTTTAQIKPRAETPGYDVGSMLDGLFN